MSCVVHLQQLLLLLPSGRVGTVRRARVGSRHGLWRRCWCVSVWLLLLLLLFLLLLLLLL